MEVRKILHEDILAELSEQPASFMLTKIDMDAWLYT